MTILAIETSCDETGAAVLGVKSNKFNLFSNIVSSQIKIHAKYGGIVPEVAARKQIEMILPVIQKSLIKAQTKLKAIDYIAVTQGPGLVTSLTVGVEAAKTLVCALGKPLVPVNHLIGHLMANYLPVAGHHPPVAINYPALGLIVSGGHTILAYMKSEISYKLIGQTLDDAVGEAFDKVAKILNLGYPGGPIISKLANQGNPMAFNLPRPMISRKNFDFSFSGLKTAVLYLVKKEKKKKDKQYIKNLCASFQQAAIDVLIAKTLRAAEKYKPKSFLLGGGVAANFELRKQIHNKISKEFPKVKIFIPSLKLAGDNAAMIAAAAYFQIKSKKQLPKDKIKTLKADPNLLF